MSEQDENEKAVDNYKFKKAPFVRHKFAETDFSWQFKLGQDSVESPIRSLSKNSSPRFKRYSPKMRNDKMNGSITKICTPSPNMQTI